MPALPPTSSSPSWKQFRSRCFRAFIEDLKQNSGLPPTAAYPTGWFSRSSSSSGVRLRLLADRQRGMFSHHVQASARRVDRGWV